ncbi:ERBB receptor feedback inhibitor 1 [Oryzias latipes]|uniref:ERBB receptor feedback inhibitor 1a n=1 Tax=Oryzias latipes TaxID=8090 RepID=H2LGW7_ORYLA|nr:ERBB receptor feedback inhibitor 1 [Oryzias latipes]
MDENPNNFWGQHNFDRMCLSADMEQNLSGLQQQQTLKAFKPNFTESQSPLYSDFYRITSEETLQLNEGDQVVPVSRRQTGPGGHQKETKPLPPLPDPEELLTDEASESEVEFFTSDRRKLIPKSCSKAICRDRRKDSGQVNFAYQESSLQDRAARIRSVAFSWPSREEPSESTKEILGASNWCFALHKENEQREVSGVGFEGKQEQPSSRFQFSWLDVPTQAERSFTSCPTEKPQIPPRIPIPPRPTKSAKEDKAPKIPPRVPLVPPCPPRTPSPKRLPIYINGVMPVTQSFAADPHYVSKALQRQQNERQQNERPPPVADFSPCIVPILRDGKKASATHYILLPSGRSAHSHRRDRLLSEPNGTGGSCSWQKR